MAAVRLLNVFQNQPLKLALTGISLVAECVWNWGLDSALSVDDKVNLRLRGRVGEGNK